MASSRLEKIGTIYSRTKGLLQSGALKWTDRPLWFDIYEAFPPKEDPRFDRPAPNTSIKEIFYTEDKIRAQLHKKFKNPGTVNLSNATSKSFTQRFIDTYRTLENQYAGTASEEKLFNESLELLNKEREAQKELADSASDLVSSFKTAQQSKEMNINVKDIFKD